MGSISAPPIEQQASVREGWANHSPECEVSFVGYVEYVHVPPTGIALKAGTRVELRSLPGVWRIDCVTNQRIMLSGPGGASAQVLLPDLRTELTVIHS